MHTFGRCTTLALCLSSFLTNGCQRQQSNPHIYKLAELNTQQILDLDRSKTVILLPGGILEEHGPYLPSYTDGYLNERLTADLAEAIAQRPGWNAVVFPVIPLGAGGANEAGGKVPFPGTYALRPDTLRSVFMDLASEFGDQGFRWLFIIHSHGGPGHNRVLDEAGDYFRDTYGGRMIHLAGLDTGQDPGLDAMKAALTAAALEEEGLSVHAGAFETSRILALRPDLVPPTVTQARSLTARTLQDVMRIAHSPEWPGYFGAPRLATADLGHRIIEGDRAWLVDIALRLLDGKVDERSIARVSALEKDPVVAQANEPGKRRDEANAQRQRAWLAARAQ
jgi:creatinine amidohydrolase/Fe(II)-dependent formamide hydrolase-like protein